MFLSHLGLRVKEKETNHINKKTYLSAKPESGNRWSQEQIEQYIRLAELNYDLNMRYFETLDGDAFNTYIEKQTKKEKMLQCTDLNELEQIPGLYMMVLDEYKQVYIGITERGIKERIRQHWNNKKYINRTVFGTACNSILSVESFGALDTTRVFYRKASALGSAEASSIKALDARYLLNREEGGIGFADHYSGTAAEVKLALLANIKTRDFVEYMTINDIERLKNILPESVFHSYLARHPQLAKKIDLYSEAADSGENPAVVSDNR